MIKFLFFAQLAEQSQQGVVELPYQQGHTVKQYINALSTIIPKVAIDALQSDTVMVSVNQQLASWDSDLSDGDEVGLLPPFSGG